MACLLRAACRCARGACRCARGACRFARGACRETASRSLDEHSVVGHGDAHLDARRSDLSASHQPVCLHRALALRRERRSNVGTWVGNNHDVLFSLILSDFYRFLSIFIDFYRFFSDFVRFPPIFFDLIDFFDVIDFLRFFPIV